MHRWNRANFDGLDAIANAADESPSLHAFAEYCRLRSAGRRKDALSVLARFLAQVAPLALAERKIIVSWLLNAQVSAPSVHQLLPHPVKVELIEPTLNQWVINEPESATPHRWLGYLCKDVGELRKALELDRGDLIARQLLVDGLLAHVEYATHHLLEGRLLGDAVELHADLLEIRGHLDEISASHRHSSLENRFVEQQTLLTDWGEYQSDPHGTFPDWCAARSRRYEWPVNVYYDA
jgi:hypothetical protein